MIFDYLGRNPTLVGVIIEPSRGDAILEGMILSRCLNFQVSK